MSEDSDEEVESISLEDLDPRKDPSGGSRKLIFGEHAETYSMGEFGHFKEVEMASNDKPDIKDLPADKDADKVKGGTGGGAAGGGGGGEGEEVGGGGGGAGDGSGSGGSGGSGAGGDR